MSALFGRPYSLEELRRRVGRLEQVAGVTPLCFSDGRGAGVRAIEVSNVSGLRVVFLADRAMDMLRLDVRGVPFAWMSQNGVSSPCFYDPRDTEFLRSFVGGMLTTCGLTNFGPGTSDQWGDAGLHGPINHIPAENVAWATVESGDTTAFEITAAIRQTRIFGENFRLHRTWRIPLCGSTIQLRDSVTNDGDAPWPHMLLYHCNAGFPLLSEDLRVHLSHSTIRPRDEEARNGMPLWNVGGTPQPTFAEQVFIHEMQATADGRALGLFANSALSLGLAIRFTPEQLPYAFTWRMLGERTYAFAIEPANCRTIQGRAVAAREGTLPMLSPAETRVYELEFEVLGDSDALERAIAGI